MVNLRNVTDRKRFERKLESQATQLQEQAELLDITDDAIIVLDMEDRIFFWNHGAEERYGWAKEEVQGGVAHELLRTAFPQDLSKIKMELQSEGRWEGELIQTKRSGENIVVESRWALRRNNQGKPIAIMEINNDITIRKQTQEALQKAKEDLEMRVAERTGELQSANERLLIELNGRKRIEEMTSKGSKKKDYEPSYRRKKIKDRLEKEGRVRGFETRWRKPDKSIMFVRENARAIRTIDGTLLYYEGTVEDITEQKKAEEKINYYQKQLRSLASDLSLAEERERRRIATMLHDHIGQILAILKIKPGALLQSAVKDDNLGQIKEVREHVEQAINPKNAFTPN
jgi:PAS domain S-box-containing protein